MFKPFDGSIYRGLAETPTLRRDDSPGEGSAGTTMCGHFSVFDVWTEIDSYYEGRFLERIAPGSFKKTFKERRNQIVVQFDHGEDVFVGSSPLGPITDLREDDIGGYYEVPLLDTDYNRDRILPLIQGRTIDGGLHGSLLGASFRFRVIGDTWDYEPKASNDNPDALPERTITEVRLFEFGPVVFPAYPDADAEACSSPVRSLTDHYEGRLRAARSSTHLADLGAATGTPREANAEPPAEHSTSPSRSLAAEQLHQEQLQRTLKCRI